MNILVNLNPGFFSEPSLRPSWDRLATLGQVNFASHDTAEEIRPDLAQANALIMWSWPELTPDLLAAAPLLRFAGHIDLSQSGARHGLEHGLAVSVSRSGFSPAVAEMALGLILTSLRRISTYHFAMRESTEPWVTSFPDGIDPRERELTGAAVGIVGYGRVGRRLAHLLAPFECRIRVYDPYVGADSVSEVEVTTLENLLCASEIVVLCAASNHASKHLLGAPELELLRPNAVLINVARAALVDTPALLTRLNRGDLFAALDVFDQEPLAPNHPLRSAPNVYLTPHRAGGVMPSVRRIVNWLVDDLEAWSQGRPRAHELVPGMIPSLDG